MSRTKTKDAPKANASSIIYTLHFEGLFYARGEHGNSEVPYNVKFKATHKQIESLRPTAIFKHYVAGKLMPRLYKNYTEPNGKLLATMNLVDAECTVPEMLENNIYLMNKEQLEDYIDEKSMPINKRLYRDYSELQQAIIDYRKDPDAFKKHQGTVAVRKKEMLENEEEFESICSIDELMELNKPAAPKKSRKQIQDDLEDI